MRLLLDEHFPPETTAILRFVHHEADHIADIGHQGEKDPQVATLAEQYDVLVTLDLYRQEEDWVAVHRAIVERGIKVLRLRLPKEATKELVNLHIVRHLTWKMEEWTAAFERDAALISISREDKELRIRTRQEVQEMLERHPAYRSR